MLDQDAGHVADCRGRDENLAVRRPVESRQDGIEAAAHRQRRQRRSTRLPLGIDLIGETCCIMWPQAGGECKGKIAPADVDLLAGDHAPRPNSYEFSYWHLRSQ